MIISEEDVRKYLKLYNPALNLGHKIGSGGTSCVFELSGTNPPQVIKVMDTRCGANAGGDDLISIQTRKELYQYFSNEIDHMMRLQKCPYIMPIVGSCVYDEDPEDRNALLELKSYRAVFMLQMPKLQKVMDYFTQHGATEALMVQLARDIGCALNFCETQHILHRDVKPDNIFVQEDGDHIRFVLGDFGYCKRISEGSNSFVTKCGTPAFMAPELELEKVKGGEYQSDLFSLGSTLYYLISGGKTPRQFINLRSKQIDPLIGISTTFSQIILSAIQPNPKHRYQHALDMLQDLTSLESADSPLLHANQYIFRTREALLHDRLSDAVEYAKYGMKHGEPECKRLLALCFYQIYLNDTNDENPYRQAYLDKAVQLLNQHLYEQDDAIARCILACIHFEKGEFALCRNKLQKSAQMDCVLAQYHYGQALYEALPGFPLDREQGRACIQQAAAQNFLPAVRYLQKICRYEHFGLSDLEVQSMKNRKWLHLNEENSAEFVFFL